MSCTVPQNPLGVLGDDERALAGVNAVGDLPPERDRSPARERKHEAHRRAAFDAVDQDVRERLDLGIVDSTQAPNGPGRRGHFRTS